MTGRGILRMTLWLLVPVLGLVALLFLFQDRMIYFPRSYAPGELILDGSRVTPIRFRTAEGGQTAFYVRPAGAGGAFPETLWVVFGGNATLALDWREFAERFPHRAGFLLVDYPGYGACEGKPGPAAILESTRGALAALAALAGDEGPGAARPVSFLGHSIGAAAALQAGSQIPARRILLIAPFTSLHAMARRSVGIPLAYLLRHDFDNQARLAEILHSPHPPAVTIIHGDRDDVIPVEMGRALAASHPGAVGYREIEGADHNSLIALQESLLYGEMTRIDIQGAKP
jgi:uncharacterized protein